MKTVKISDIAIDGETQQREKINESIVEEYAEAMRCGAKFTPVDLFFDGAQFWLADGFHRYHAHRMAEIPTIVAEVRDGTRRDARLFSAGANGTHGMRLTNADKRKSVLVLLNDGEWMNWSDSEIARHCHVSQPFVGKLRNELHDELKVKSQHITVIGTGSKPNNDAEAEKEKPSKSAENSPTENQESENINPANGQHETDAEYEARMKQSLMDTIDHQHQEIVELNERIAIGALDIPESEQVDIQETIAGLRAAVKTLTATVDAVSAMRDQYMRECAELKKQCAAYLRTIKKLEAKSTAAFAGLLNTGAIISLPEF